jgi:hypothetical protein
MSQKPKTNPPVKGPEKPWSEDMERAAQEFVDFLQNSGSKKAITEFLIDAYKKFEGEKVQSIQARIEHEKEVSEKGSTPFYKPGNLGTLLHEEFNMGDVEHAFTRSLRGTKESILRSVEDRVEAVNRLLSDIGGFSAQLKSSFARSTVVFLEQEDPKHTFRERLIFSVNLPNYELKLPWDRSKAKGKKSTRDQFGRASLQATWDEAVNALARIVETTGLKPKYCKNDRHYGRFVMKQDLRSRVNLPDEYFSFILDYNTEDKIQEMCVVYDKIVDDYEAKLKRLSDQLKKYPSTSRAPKFLEIKRNHLDLSQERDFFVGTTPDPNQLDEGLLFQIEVSTLKDYHIVKDRMQSIMTRYILYLSKIAAKEAEANKEMKYQLSKADELTRSALGEGEPSLEGVPEYEVDSDQLKSLSQLQKRPPPMKKKKAA